MNIKVAHNVAIKYVFVIPKINVLLLNLMRAYIITLQEHISNKRKNSQAFLTLLFYNGKT